MYYVTESVPRDAAELHLCSRVTMLYVVLYIIVISIIVTLIFCMQLSAKLARWFFHLFSVYRLMQSVCCILCTMYAKYEWSREKKINTRDNTTWSKIDAM